MSTNNNQNQPKIKLALAEPIPFNGTADTALVSTLTLAKYINELFFGTFIDYIGCRIYPNTDNAALTSEPVVVDLHFSLNGNNNRGGKYQAFVPVGTAEASTKGDAPNNYLAMAGAHNARINTTSASVITQDACDLLFDCIGFPVNQKVKCNPKSFKDAGMTVEINAGNAGIQCIVRGISINSIMKILYGGKNNEHDFFVAPIKPITLMSDVTNGFGGVNNDPKNFKWLYVIYKMDKSAIQDLYNEMGLYNKIADSGVITATF